MEKGLSVNKTFKMRTGTKIKWFRPGGGAIHCTINLTRFDLFGCKISQVILGRQLNDYSTVDNMAEIH